MSSSTSDVTSEIHDLKFIRAGAGAGKTTRLIRTFIDFSLSFYHKNKRYPRVVITTFTRKATQEVKERLLVSALKDGQKEVFEYINKKSQVHISTIHGLLSLYLSQNADLLSLPQEIRIVDSNKSLKTLKKNIYQIIKKNNLYLDILEQYPFYQLVEIVENGLELRAQSSNLELVTSSELKDLWLIKKNKVILLLNEILELIPVIPDKWSEYFSYLSTTLLLLNEQNEQKLLLHLEQPPRKPIFSEKKPPFDERAHQKIEELRELDIFTIQDTVEYREKHDRLNKLFLNFINDLYALDQVTKKRTGELTISDLENFSLKLIEEFPQSAVDFSNTWDYFMIDEYQDTSPLQVKILNQLVREKSCFIVGDPQQSIYLFRGARSEVFEEKEVEFKRKKNEIVILDTNYRSKPALMACINDFFDQFSQQFRPMQLKEDSGEKEQSFFPEAFYIKTHNQTYAAVKQIQYLLKNKVEPKDICVLSRKNSNLIEIARLAYQFDVPVQLQTAAGFEEKREILDLVSFLKFLVNPHDDFNLVTLLRSPWLYLDDQILVDICHKQEAKFHSIWTALLKNESQVTIVTKEKLQSYIYLYEQIGSSLTLKNFIEQSEFLIFSELLDPTGKREANIWKFLKTLTEAERQNGFSLGAFLEDQFQSLQSDLGSSAGEAQPVVQPDCVSLMTVHAAKGLEFKHVIVVGFTDRPQQTNQMSLAFDESSKKISLSVFVDSESKHLPSVWSQNIRKLFNQRELQESERILYVALTRAKETISLVAELAEPGQKKIILNESWYKKINWPEPSDDLIISENKSTPFKIQSVFYDQNLEQHQAHIHSFVEPRAKYLDIEKMQVKNSSVTQLLDSNSVIGQSDQNNKVLSTDFIKSIQNFKKAQKGTDLHRLFESLKFNSLDDLKQSISAEDNLLIDYLMNQKSLNLLEVLKFGFTEWGFGLQTKDGRLQGQIDVWAELDDAIHILDYKTGSSEYFEKAYMQLSIYTSALIKMNMISKDKKIIHSILYPYENKILQQQFKDANSFLKSTKLKLPPINEYEE